MVDSARLFRVFVSSSFVDMAQERRALAEGVFAPLAELCARRGASFQAVDLRWGISPQAALEQQTMPICLTEVRRCVRVSPQLNFLALVGGRRGWLPVPTAIPAHELALLDGELTTAERRLVDEWYRVDRNVVPVALRLVPRAGRYVDDAEWAPAERRLREVMQRLAHRLPEPRRLAYTGSAVEQEVAAGVFEMADPVGAFALVRQQRGDDVPTGDVSVDEHRHVRRLEARLRARLPPDRVLTYPSTPGDPAPYRHQLVAAVHERFRAVIESALDGDPVAVGSGGASAVHGRLAGRLLAGTAETPQRQLVGRDEAVEALSRFARAAGRGVLALVGQAGVGKTALLGTVAADLAAGRDAPGSPLVILRLLGTTAATTRVDDVVRGLVEEIANSLDDHAEPAPDIAGLTRQLGDLLTRAGRPVVMILDAVDQLAADHAAHRLGWLPDPLPAQARVILSTVPGPIEEALGRRTDCTVRRLTGLSRDEGARLLRRWLDAAGRTLTSGQERAVLDAFTGQGRPLWLRLAFEQAASWHSDSPPVALPPDLADLVRLVFDRLAGARGPVLVRHTLELLAASGVGLSELDLIDVLSADAEVLTEVRARAHERWRPGLSALPVVLWAQLRADLQPYLTERDVDGDVLVDFYHRVLRDVAGGDETRPSGAARHLQLAALFARTADPDGTRSWRGAAPRAFDRLPAHLQAGRAWAELTQTLLDFGFLEAKAALVRRVPVVDRQGRRRTRHGGVHAARADVADLIAVAPLTVADRAVCVAVAHALGLEADLLTARPELLWQQLSNRLRWDGPPELTARLDDEEARRTTDGRARWLRLCRPLAETPGLHHVLRERGRARSCALSRDGTVLATGGDIDGALWDATDGTWLADLPGHHGPVHACAIAPDDHAIYTGDEAGTVRRWSFDGVRAQLHATRRLGDRPLRACACAVGHIVVAGRDGLQLCARDGLEVVATLDHSPNVSCCAVDDRGDLVVAGYLDGTVRTWQRRGDELRPAARRPDAHRRSVNGCAVDTTGTVVLTAGQDGALRRWDTGLRPRGRPLVDHDLPVPTGLWACAATGTLDHAVTALVGGAVQAWDVARATVTTLAGHAGHVNAVAISDDATVVASAGFDGTVRLWRPAEAGGASAEPFSAMVQALAISTDGGRVLSVDAYGIVRIGRTLRGTGRPDAQRHVATCRTWCHDGAATADLDTLVVVDQAGTVEVWDVRDRPHRRHLLPHANAAACVMIGDDVAVSAGDDGTCHGWDVVRGTRMWTVELGHGVPVLAGTSHPPRVLAAAGSGAVELVDASTGRATTLRDAGDPVLCAAFGPDGAIAVGTDHGELLRWQANGAVALPPVRGHDARMLHVAPGTSRYPFLSACADGDLVLWAADAGAPAQRWSGHEGPVRSVAVDPGAGVAVSAGDDKTLRVWNLSGEQRALLPLAGNGQALALHRPSGTIVCGDDGGFVYVATLSGPRR